MAADTYRRTVTENPYIPALEGKFPSIQQAKFLVLPHKEGLYGGAAGGGKSAALLAGGLQYVTESEYHSLLIRRSYTDLEKPGGLIPLSIQWLSGTNAKYDQTKHRWFFPSGATLSFGHAANLTTLIQDYQGSSFGYIAPDELTQWPFAMYRFLFRSLRGPSGMPFPLRMRASANPGGEGHEWVKARFIDCPSNDERFFIPAKLEDNPGVGPEYEESLNELDPVMRRQLRHGDWEVRPEGNMFRREWFTDCYVDRAPAGLTCVRFWDIETARIDGRATSIRIEQEPGAGLESSTSITSRVCSVRSTCAVSPAPGQGNAREAGQRRLRAWRRVARARRVGDGLP
jgi:hypothetical protein